ncbi:uncharacterized protein V6R79_008594 [Siganus canaliculatus]
MRNVRQLMKDVVKKKGQLDFTWRPRSRMMLRGSGPLLGFLWFIHLLPATKGGPQLIVSPLVIGLVGDDIILPCGLHPPENVIEKTVEWTRSDLSPAFVHVFTQGRMLFDNQNPLFHGRTSLNESALRTGVLSLKLLRLQLSHQGNYTCKVVTPESQPARNIRLVVGAASEPSISPVATKDTMLVLECEAKNWFPEPSMEWRDSEGKVMTPEDSHTEHKEFYSVRSRIAVEIKVNDTYTCTVRQVSVNATREANFTIAEFFEKVPEKLISDSTMLGIVVVLGMIICTLFLGIFMYLCAQRCPRLPYRLISGVTRRITEETPMLHLRSQQAEVDGAQDGEGNLESEINNLETTRTTLQGEISVLESTRTTLQGEISVLESTRTTLQGEISVLESTRTTLQGEISVLESTRTTLQGEISVLESTRTTLQGKISVLESTRTTLQGEISVLESTRTTRRRRWSC